MAYIAVRYVLAFLGMMGIAIIFGLQINLSVAIVVMVDHKDEYQKAWRLKNMTDGKKDDCAHLEDEREILENGPFSWSSHLQGIILSSYFWGHMVTQIPGARMAERVSAKFVMFLSVTINMICTLLIPISANFHYSVLIVVRIIQGLGAGVCFPAMHVMIAHWAPKRERGVISSLIYAGSVIGISISLLTSGLIANELDWQWIFYIMGSACSVWLLLWLVLVSDTPVKQYCISAREKEYILKALSEEGVEEEGHPHVPWKKLFKSMPFWAILIAHTCSNWGWYMMITELPTYMKMVLKVHIFENVIFIAIPFISMWFFSIILGKILDTLRVKRGMSTTCAKKIATFIASAGPLTCLMLLCYIGCKRIYAVILITICIMTMGGIFCGFLSNHIDIAPNFAGTLMGITNTVATIPGIVVPIFVGEMTEVDPTIASWNIIFFVTVGLYGLELVMYTAFGSGKEAKWNRLSDEEPGN